MEKDPDVRVDKLFVVGEVMPVEVSTLPFLCHRSHVLNWTTSYCYNYLLVKTHYSYDKKS